MVVSLRTANAWTLLTSTSHLRNSQNHLAREATRKPHYAVTQDHRSLPFGVLTRMHCINAAFHPQAVAGALPPELPCFYKTHAVPYSSDRITSVTTNRSRRRCKAGRRSRGLEAPHSWAITRSLGMRSYHQGRTHDRG